MHTKATKDQCQNACHDLIFDGPIHTDGRVHRRPTIGLGLAVRLRLGIGLRLAVRLRLTVRLRLAIRLRLIGLGLRLCIRRLLRIIDCRATVITPCLASSHRRTALRAD